MSSRESFPILSVEDLPATVAFYERLGFTPSYAFPSEGPTAFVTLTRERCTIGIAARGAPSGDRFSYWVYVDDVDALFADLVRAGAAPASEPRTEPWGERVASVRDPDGNVVHIGAPSGSAGPAAARETRHP